MQMTLANYSFKQQNLKAGVVFLSYWVLLLILYWPARHAGFEGDFAGWLHSFKTESFWEIFHRKNNKVQSLYQLTMTELWVCTKLFGRNYLAWFLLQTCLHALNAMLLFQMLQRYLSFYYKAHIQSVSLWASALFLLGYTHVEPIVWKGAFHYLTGVMMLLIIINQTLLFIQTKHIKHACMAVIVFALSCFSLEIFYLSPLLVAGLASILFYTGKISAQQWRHTMKWMVLPMLLCFVLYYILYLSTYQKAIAHYGYKSNAWTLQYLLPKWRMYPMRILFFDGELAALNNTIKWLGYALLSLVFVDGIFFIFQLKKLAPVWQAITFLLWGTALGIAIVSPLGYDATHQIRNGHYAYTASVFLLPLAVIFIYAVCRNIKFTVVATVMWLLVHVFFIMRNVQLYKHADVVFKNLLNTFPDKKSERTKVILAMPSTFKGIVMVGADTIDRFKDLYEVFHDDSINGKVYSVSAYNMEQLNDAVQVNKQVQNNTLALQLINPASMWHYRYFAPFSFSNDLFSVDFSNDRKQYFLKRKDQNPAIDFYYFSQNKWYQLLQ